MTEPFEPKNNEEGQDLPGRSSYEEERRADEAPDFNKPQPGESYADYMHRLDRARKAEMENLDHSREEYWSGLTDYGRGKSGDPNYGPIPEEYSMNGMSKAAFACGILSIVTVFFGFSLFFGALGVIFALLSRKTKFGRQSRIALWMSSAGIFAFFFSLIITIHMLVSSGIWGRMVERIRNMDPNDPNAAAVLEEQLLEEILGTYGVQSVPGTRA